MNIVDRALPVPSHIPVGVRAALDAYESRLQGHLQDMRSGIMADLLAREARLESLVNNALGSGLHTSTADRTSAISVAAVPSGLSDRELLPTLLGASTPRPTVATAEKVAGHDGSLAPTPSSAVPSTPGPQGNGTSSGVASSSLALLSLPFKRKTSREMIMTDARHHWRRMIQKTPPRRSQRSRILSLPKQQLIAQRVVRSHAYEMFTLFLVLSNAAFIGWHVQHVALHHEDHAAQFSGELLFTVVFVIELALRLFAERDSFFLSAELCWNIFDLFVVAMMLMELALRMSAEHDSTLFAQLSIVRVLRVVRAVRVIRIIRVLKFFRELRMMIYSILSSFKSFVWVMMLQCILIYVFGICLTQGTINFCMAHNAWAAEETAELRRHFGTLSTSGLSLFEGMAGGISWGELVDVLEPLDGVYAALFLVFVAFSVFAVVNIVTGIFVDSAMQSSQTDRDLLIQEEIHAKEDYLAKIQQIFNEIDVDGSGTVDMSEFSTAIEDERLVAYFNALDLDITDVKGLFSLLDRDRTGEIDIEEFVVGCLRLRGGAKSLDLAKLLYESEYMVHNLERLMDTLRRSSRRVAQLSDRHPSPSASRARRTPRESNVGGAIASCSPVCGAVGSCSPISERGGGGGGGRGRGGGGGGGCGGRGGVGGGGGGGADADSDNTCAL